MSNRKKLIIFIISVIVLTLVISLTVALVVAYFNANKDWVGSLIGSLGNIIGGIIGGYVAYIVASYQIESSTKMETEKVNSRYKNLKASVIEELNFTKKIIDTMVSSSMYDLSLLKESGNFDAWQTFKIEYAINFSEDQFSTLCSLYRRLQLLQNSNPEDVNERRLDKISRDIESGIEILKRQ